MLRTVSVLPVGFLLTLDLFSGALVLAVVDDVVVLAAVLPVARGHQFFGRFRISCPTPKLGLAELQVQELAVRPHQTLDM